MEKASTGAANPVPRVVVQGEGLAVGSGPEGPVLGKGTHQGGAARATVQPQDHCVVVVVVCGKEKEEAVKTHACTHTYTHTHTE